jgi:hypothetical protein
MTRRISDPNNRGSHDCDAAIRAQAADAFNEYLANRPPDADGPHACTICGEPFAASNEDYPGDRIYWGCQADGAVACVAEHCGCLDHLMVVAAGPEIYGDDGPWLTGQRPDAKRLG